MTIKEGCALITKDLLERDYVSAPEAAEMLNLGRNQIGKLCRAGRFEGAAQIGNAWIIPRKSVENYTPGPRGPKPGTQSKKIRLDAERAAFLKQASVYPAETSTKPPGVE